MIRLSSKYADAGYQAIVDERKEAYRSWPEHKITTVICTQSNLICKTINTAPDKCWGAVLRKETQVCFSKISVYLYCCEIFDKTNLHNNFG